MSSKVLLIRQALREKILSGRLRPRTRLRVRDLAAEFGVSPTPVREALRMLESDGLVVITPNSSVEVASMSAREVEEFFFIRGHLEALATEAAVGNLTPRNLAELRKLNAAMTDAAERGDGLEYAALNKRFHSAIYDSCPYPRLIRLIGDMWNGGTKFQVIFRAAPQRMSQSQRDHCELLRLMEAGDAKGAADCTLKHKLSGAQMLIDLLTAAGEA